MTTAAVTPLKMVIEVGVERPILGRASMVTKLEGWDGGGVEVRGSSTDRSRAHGTFAERGWRGARVLSIEGSSWADTRRDAAEMVDDLNAFLAEGTLGEFEVLDPDLGTRTVRGKLIGTPEVDWDGLQDIDWAFDVECPDPRKYGEAFRVTTRAPVDGGGLSFPLFGGFPRREIRRNLVADPRATRVLPAYLAEGTRTVVTPVSGNPDKITSANRVSYTAGQSNIGVALFAPMVPGKTYTVSAWVRHEAIGTGTSFGFAEAGVTSGPAIAPAPVGTWQRVSWTRTATSSNHLGFRTGSATSAGSFLITGILVEEGSVLGAYFDGSMPSRSAEWLGEANVSASAAYELTGTEGVLDFGERPEEGTISYSHRGTADTWPLIKVEGPTPGFTVTESETGRRLEFGTLGRNETLWLDARTGTARVNDVQDRSTALIRAEWPYIPGRSTRTYVLSSPEGPDAKMTLEVRPAWW